MLVRIRISIEGSKQRLNILNRSIGQNCMRRSSYVAGPVSAESLNQTIHLSLNILSSPMRQSPLDISASKKTQLAAISSSKLMYVHCLRLDGIQDIYPYFYKVWHYA